MLSLLNTTFTNAVRKGFTLVGSLLSKLRSRSAYFENKNCTKATLQDLDDVNLLEKASIVTTPTAYNDGSLNSVKGGEDADFDFQRGSAATRVNKEGLIEVVENDLPRIDYTDGCGSLLLEPQSTNLVLTSASGTYGNSPGSEANTTSPDGTNNAVIPTPDSSSDRYGV